MELQKFLYSATVKVGEYLKYFFLNIYSIIIPSQSQRQTLASSVEGNVAPLFNIG